MELDALAGLLTIHWGLATAEVTPLGGGMNSETWLVRAGGSSYVAKRVSSSDVEQLEGGCAAAEMLSSSGLRTGSPVRTSGGSLIVRDARLALLEYVPGRELDGSSAQEQHWMADTLARAHSVGAPMANGPGSTGFFDWLKPSTGGASAPTWLGPAIETARATTDELPVTWSVLHTDPAPEAFRHDETTGVTGLIDWTGARRGPVLYDVASAVMYLGGPAHATAFLDAYAAVGPLGPEELDHLDDFRRFRLAVQGAYFAGRLAAHDLTGITTQIDNEHGLDDARRGLAEMTTERGEGRSAIRHG